MLTNVHVNHNLELHDTVVSSTTNISWLSLAGFKTLNKHHTSGLYKTLTGRTITHTHTGIACKYFVNNYVTTVCGKHN